MKTIIVPTDFSVPAENAAVFAAQLAGSIGASLVLLHVYQIPVSMNEVPVMMVSAEALKQNAEGSLTRSKELLSKNFPSLQIRTESRMGDIVDELKDLSRETDPYLVVVSSNAAKGVERFLLGSTSLSIIRRSHIPVLAIPASVKKAQFANIALAIDDPEASFPEARIMEITNDLKAVLHIVHVQSKKEDSKELNPATLRHAGINVIRDDEFIHGIQSFISTKQIDLLILLPHKHSVVERLFFKTHTAELMEKLQIPLLCINED
jgi:nucleotide-binding universal stress UspA family protein